MLVRELLAGRNSIPVLKIEASQQLIKVVRKLHHHNIGALLVADENNQIEGLISERDLIGAIATYEGEALSKTVSDFMTNEVISCSPSDEVAEILHTMNDHHIRHMPVVESGQAIAMMSIREFDKACKELEQQALTDNLTEISNRRYFDRQLKVEFDRFRRNELPLSLAILDIDEFKAINDKYGHEEGDRVLKALAAILRSELRGADVVARLGGEEFGILFPDTKASDAASVCERIMRVIQKTKVTSGRHAIGFTASFGITEADMETLSADVIVNRADQLMYSAKSNGRNCIVVDPQFLGEQLRQAAIVG